MNVRCPAGNRRRIALAIGLALLCPLCAPPAFAAVEANDAAAQSATGETVFDIPAQPLPQALQAFMTASGERVAFDVGAVRGKRSTPVHGAMPAEAALQQMLQGTGLVAQTTASGFALRATTQLGTIYVTALKRSESLQQVPSSITAMTSADLQNRGATGIDDIVERAPGLSNPGAGPNQANLTMRGVTTGTSLQLLQTTVGLLIDDIPADPGVITSGTTDLRLFDIQRVEVLRGPQGTLFGSGSLSGAVRLITNKPDLDQFAMSAQLTGSSTEDGAHSGGVSAMLNVPLVKGKLGLRVVAYTDNQGGWIDNITTGAKRVNSDNARGGRILLSAQPTDRLSFLWTTLYQKDEPGSDGRSFYYRPSLQDYWRLEDPQTETRIPIQSTIHNLVAKYDFEHFTLTSSTSYANRKRYSQGDESPFIDFLGILFGIPGGLHGPAQDLAPVLSKTWTEDLRLNSLPSSAIQWTLGGYYQHTVTTDNEVLTSPVMIGVIGTPIFAGIDTRIPQKEEALYGEATFPLGEKWKLTTGLRLARSDVSYRSVQCCLLITGNPDPSVTTSTAGEIRQNSIDPRVALSYQWTPDVMVYAQAARGFRTGGPNVGAGLAVGIPLTYKSDSLWNYEIGEKARFRDGSVQLNSALYLIDWSDIQVGLSLPTANFIGNAGKARVVGLETEAIMQPVHWLQLGTSFSISHGELTDDVPTLTRVTGQVGVSKGERLPASPQFKIANFLQASFPVAGHDAYFRIDHQYVSSEYTDFGKQGTRFGDYSVVNLRAGVYFDHFELIGFINNAFNSKGAASALDEQDLIPPPNPLVLLPQSAYRVRPRTVGVTIRADF